MNRFVLAASAAVVCGMSASMSSAAVLPVPVNDWQMLYDAHSLPNAANSVWLPRQSTSAAVTQFTAGATGGTAGISDIGGGDDVLTYNTLGTDGSRYYTFGNINTSDFHPNSATGYTFETRVKLVGLDTTGTGAAAVFDFDEATSGVDKYWKLLFYKDTDSQYKVLFSQLNGVGGLIETIDNTAFHTYRVTVKDSIGTLYIDGADKGTITQFDTTATNSLRFGDLTGTADGEVQVDYVRMNDTGAIPVPEPVSLSALAAAGLLLMRRRGGRS